MWLPKEERKLLVIYFQAIQSDFGRIYSNPTQARWYDSEELLDVFRSRYYKKKAKELKDCREATTKKTSTTNTESGKESATVMKQFLRTKAAVDVTNDVLAARKLIMVEKRSPGESLSFRVGLTIEGLDLGRKYSSWFTESGLWFRECKDHWFCLLVVYVVGAFTPKLIELIKSLFAK